MTNPKQMPRKPLRLPFEKRTGDGDWGHWVYKHRIGLLSTVVVFLLGAISFLSYRIVLNKEITKMIAIEFEKEQTPEPEKQATAQDVKKMKEIERLMMEEMKAQNRINNQGGKLNSALKDSKRSNAKNIYDDVERINRELAAGRDAYQKGLNELSSQQNRHKQEREQRRTNNDNRAKESDRNQASQVKGDVFVSYELQGRNHLYLHIPAYQCQWGGVVVVAITVNRSGKVVAANVDKATSSGDGCISQMAVQSALASTFSASNNAPDKQKGTITYRFVPQ